MNSTINQHLYLLYALTRTIRRCLSASSQCLCGSWLIILFLFLSCTRNPENAASNESDYVAFNGARPMAVLQTGEYPIWFQLTEDGPVYIVSIEDAYNTTSLAPWPYAFYISFLQKKDGALLMVSNRDGFIKIAPNTENDDGAEHSDLLLYRFSGGEMWKQYTAGGFVFYEGFPAALIYLDDRFLDSDLLQPKERAWSFNMETNNLFPVVIPVLQFFPVEDGWEVDALRTGADGLFYYRAAKRSGDSPSVQMFRASDLKNKGEEIPVDIFYSSFPKRIDFSDMSLPDLPEGFFYTGMEEIEGNIFALWEEQHDYSIGAAGFMLIKK